MHSLIKWYKGAMKEEIENSQIRVIELTPQAGIVDATIIMQPSKIEKIEEPFEIELLNIKEMGQEISRNHDSLIAYIGRTECIDDKTIYDINRHKFIKKQEKNTEVIATSKSGKITSIEYLSCIVNLLYEAVKEHKQLIIYNSIHIIQEEYRTNSLMEETVQDLLKQFNDIEDYGKNKKKVRNNAPSLYEDIFYEEIPDNEEIYVPVITTSTITPSQYEALGFEYINIVRAYGILRGTKQKFNQALNELYDNVLPQFRPQILLPSPMIKEQVNLNNSGVFKASSLYNGKDVYIGIVGVDGVDYTNNILRNNEGITRIAYAWEQEVGESGKVYTAQDIQRAIDNNEKLSIYPQQEDYFSTTLLGVAAGNVQEPVPYKSVGNQSMLLVAKIKKASETIQKIYGGTVNDTAVLLEDILIGINKMVEFANDKRKPIIICLPYGSNISSHDGRKILETRLGAFAIQPGITIITMTGEEADKAHHASLEVFGGSENRVNVVVKKNRQRVMGSIWINPVYELEVKLYNPSKNNEYDLTKRTIYITGDEKIISNGEWIRYDNGLKQIFFGMENLQEGKWQLVLTGIDTETSYEDEVNIWLTQESINPYITLSPANVFTTITSLGNVDNFICVGNYNKNIFNVQKSSGRGYTADDTIKPTLVTSGMRVTATVGANKWAGVTGSVVAMAIMAGVVAAIYSKYIQNNERWFPNSLVMTAILTSSLTRVDTITYPNQSQGNGIFDESSLEKILDINYNI